MGNPIAGLLGGGLREIVDAVGGVLDGLSTTAEEKLEAQRKLIEIERNFQTRMAEIDAQVSAQQAEVVKAEAESSSWLAANWRPILMLTFTYIIAHNFVIVPVFGITAAEIPADMWDLLKIGVGGYVIGRSVEKTAPAVVGAMKK